MALPSARYMYLRSDIMDMINIPNKPGTYDRGPVRINVTPDEILIYPREGFREVQEQKRLPPQKGVTMADRINRAADATNALNRLFWG